VAAVAANQVGSTHKAHATAAILSRADDHRSANPVVRIVGELFGAGWLSRSLLDKNCEMGSQLEPV